MQRSDDTAQHSTGRRDHSVHPPRLEVLEGREDVWQQEVEEAPQLGQVVLEGGACAAPRRAISDGLVSIQVCVCG